MKKFTLNHEINCSADQFWKVFFDQKFNTTLFLEELGFPEFEVLEQTDDGGKVKRRVRGRPKMNAPKAVQKVLGESFGYEEEGNFDPESKVWSWKMIPNTLANKLVNQGKVRVEAIDDSKCRRVADIHVEAKVFGVGGLLEKFTETEMRNGWDKSAVFMNKWIRDNPPG